MQESVGYWLSKGLELDGISRGVRMSAGSVRLTDQRKDLLRDLQVLSLLSFKKAKGKREERMASARVLGRLCMANPLLEF